MNLKTEEIKPCPSGCNPKQFIRICNIENRDYFIQCSCGWSTAHYMTKESAIKAWNTRCRKEEILKLHNEFVNKIHPIDPGIVKLVDENFWSLLLVDDLSKQGKE